MQSRPTSRLRSLVGLAPGGALLAAAFGAGAADLSLQAPTLSYSGVPGEYRESRMNSRSTLTLQPGLSWSTTTGLTGTRYGTGVPMRSEAFDLSTGPRVKLGRAELELPLTSGREMNNLYGYTSWSGGASNLSVALGPKDHIRLEAKLNSRSDALSSRTRRSANLSWRHAFTERWAIRAGLLQSHETENGGDETLRTESYASLNASLSSGWRWDLQGSLRTSEYRGTGGFVDHADRRTLLTLTSSKIIIDRWRLSGSLSASQSTRTDLGSPVNSRSGGIRLQREF